ncbi:hypothetical protein L0337_34930 [candidate division KSB1 bacterium]|nr:hypothetical protein [candidate division KSB1 bacterium]
MTAFYSLSESVALVGILPIVRRAISVKADEVHGHDEHGHNGGEADHQGSNHSHTTAGSVFSIGDISFLGRYTFLARYGYKQSLLLAMKLGIKIPTGITDAVDNAGNFLDAHIQPGTGSWNYLVGLSFNYVKNPFGLTSNFLYSLNTGGKAGADEYRFGNWLNADITAKYPIPFSSRILVISLGMYGEFRGKEKINGQSIANSGGEVLYVFPGLELMLSRSFRLEASVLYPFRHNLNGADQLGENFKLVFGMKYLLN